MSTTTPKLPVEAANTATAPQAMAQIPPARPSSPSLRFTALVIPTIQKSVSGQENQPKFSVIESVITTDLIRIPTAQTSMAEAICAVNLTRARRPFVLTSSISPAINMKPAAKSRKRSCPSMGWSVVMARFENHSTVMLRAIMDRKMATPPTCDTGCVCMCRAPGTSTMSSRRAIRITAGVIIIASTREPRYTNK